MRTFSFCVFLMLAFAGSTGALRAQDFSKLSDTERKQVNDWLAERAQIMIVAHKLENEIKQSWSNDKYSTPEIEALRKRYRELQQELIGTQQQLQKKVQETPAVIEKRRQLDAAKQSVQELTKKVSGKLNGPQ